MNIKLNTPFHIHHCRMHHHKIGTTPSYIVTLFKIIFNMFHTKLTLKRPNQKIEKVPWMKLPSFIKTNFVESYFKEIYFKTNYWTCNRMRLEEYKSFNKIISFYLFTSIVLWQYFGLVLCQYIRIKIVLKKKCHAKTFHICHKSDSRHKQIFMPIPILIKKRKKNPHSSL